MLVEVPLENFPFRLPARGKAGLATPPGSTARRPGGLLPERRSQGAARRFPAGAGGGAGGGRGMRPSSLPFVPRGSAGREPTRDGQLPRAAGGRWPSGRRGGREGGAAAHWLAQVWERERSGVHTPAGGASLNSREASARGPGACRTRTRGAAPAGTGAQGSPCRRTRRGSREPRRGQSRSPAPAEPPTDSGVRPRTGRWDRVGPGREAHGGTDGRGTQPRPTARPAVLQAGHGEAAPSANQREPRSAQDPPPGRAQERGKSGRSEIEGPRRGA